MPCSVAFSDVRVWAVSVTSPRAYLSYASSYAFVLFLQTHQGVVEGRQVDVWDIGFALRRGHGHRVRHKCERASIDQLRQFVIARALIVLQLVQLCTAVDRVGERESQRQHICVGDTQHGAADGLRLRHRVHEPWI
jgi:hypothetical protein